MRKDREQRREGTDGSDAMSFAVLGVALAAVACCGLPALVAALGAGTLSGLLARGSGLGLVLALLIAALIAALVYTIYRTVKAKRTSRRSETDR